MRLPFKERRDWTLLILILPLGILLMLLAGQMAIRLMPSWSVSADISSKVNPGEYLDTNNLPDSFAPVRPDILTPMSWADSFLTPQAQVTDTSVVPFVVLNPSATPTSPTVVSPSPSPSATPPTVTTTPSPTGSPTGSPTAPPTIPATATKEPKDPPPATPSPTASPTLPPVTSTIDPAVLTELTATPDGFNEGAPDGSNASGTDFPDGSYFVIDVSSNPVVVNATSDGHYDLVYYEDENPDGSNQVAMDQVIVGISNDPSGNPYYQVFNWGDGIRDTNTNVDTAVIGVPSAEVDNQVISTNDLYEDPSSPSPPPNLQTGVLIDVDQAPSHPPPDTYEYVVVIAPPDTNPNNAGDAGQVDSVQVTEVTSPVPP